MKRYTECSQAELIALQDEWQTKFDHCKKLALKLDMSRGKPGPEQLDLSRELLRYDLADGMTESGVDARNYGGLEGLTETRAFFSEVLDIPAQNMIIGGNSSLNLMYDAVVRCLIFGTGGHTPWSKLPKVRFLCPSPGYDRHFAICEELGIEMIVVPMTSTGPDMDMVEKLVAEDDSIKGIWCVPLYSNPQGICYSDETVERLAAMRCAAPDFRIFWDNAYGVHHLAGETPLRNIFEAAGACGNSDRVYYFFSTSKITFPGAGVALVAASPANIAEISRHMTIQTIGHDKLNQLRTVRFLKNADGVREQMRRQAALIAPKFQLVLSHLEKELGGSGVAEWETPAGGYFVAVDTLDGCARETVALAAEAGVKLTSAGATFPYHKDPRDRNIRIAPTYPSLAELDKAMQIFCVCVKLAAVRRLLDGQK
ncbi:MAG: aminotransferase class I/II-fold pyridoxal phosphate-dependent enzyme [Lentisphaeria bacterium]|nr:aminotransferase class I/II-fold pyridoxal phosphate-dependent enzyme [Lentisphaeria bacterium]